MDWDNILEIVELKVVGEHNCKLNEDCDIAVLQCEYTPTGKLKWHLATAWIAGLEEVSDGEADEVGEVIKLTTVQILYCPFCGKKL